MRCPQCSTEMDEHDRHGVKIDHCPACGGVWLDHGELDHLLAAVRPPVTQPDPGPARPVPAPPQPDMPRGRTLNPPKAPRLVLFEDREPEREPKKAAKKERKKERKKAKKAGKSHPYGKRTSKSERLKDILEDIFDFD